MPNDKSDNQRRHLKQRMKERLGIDLNHKALAQLKEQIQQRTAHLIKKQTNRCFYFAVELDGQFIPVIWDKHRLNLVTVLPSDDPPFVEWLKEYNKETQ